MTKARRAAPDPRLDAAAEAVCAAFDRAVPADVASEWRISLAGELLLHEVDAAARAAGEPVVEVLIRVVGALLYAETGDPAVLGLPPEARH